MTTSTAELPTTGLHTRTEQERLADRYAANAFFARFEGYRPNSTDWRWRSIQKQIIEREVLDSKLLMAAHEAHEWSQKHKDGAKERTARRAITDGKISKQELALDPNMLRDYTTAETRWSMPSPRLGTQSTTKRAQHRAAARGFTSRITTGLQANTPQAAHLRSIAERESAPFEHWLLRFDNRSYGPQRPAPFEGFDGHLRPTTPHRSALSYRAGRITVVGMTPARALEIAIAADKLTAPPAPISRSVRRAAREAANAEKAARRAERELQQELSNAEKERNRKRIESDRALETRQGGF